MTAVDVDALDAALSKVQPPVSVFAGLTQDHEYPSDVNALYRDGGSAAFAECYGEDSAALIVAAVNALPELLAEVRRGRALREAVEGLAEERESLAQRLRSAAAEPGRNLGQKWNAENRAHDAERETDRLRAALAAGDPS